MSAESVQAYVNWIKQSNGINSQVARQLNSITSQINALNPGNPDSPAQLAALQKQTQEVLASRQSQLAAVGPTPNPANYTEKERAQVGGLVGLSAGNGFIEYRNALDSLQSAGAAAKTNIETTQSAGTSRGQTSPVTTGDGTSKPVTNVAASANTTTKTIDDIYDPNLTPEQIASLSPGDRQARADTLADEVAGAVDPNTFDQEIVVTGARQQQQAFQARNDWRVRLALSDDPGVNYLYKAPDPGILKPLNKTNGVIFPYTPTISVNYAANYNPTELVHSNYKVFQYSSSSIDLVTIMSDFTAQDEYEANYLLAVIHFFRSATKMFYGQDQNPRKGTPPPLCYIYGMGSHQFAGQPLAIQSFSYNLPNNVDYIKTSVGGDTASATTQPARMAGTGAAPGGVLPPPKFTPTVSPDNVSWIPSKIQLSITCVPMMNRNAVSNEFSFEKYATGTLLNGVRSRSGGFW